MSRTRNQQTTRFAERTMHDRRVHNGDTQRPVPSRQELHLLLVEDVESDALLIELELRNAGLHFVMKRVDTGEEFVRMLQQFRFDVIISDYHLPGFSAVKALSIVKELHIDTPFILVTGSQSEEIAVECIRLGADDYLLKQSLARLPSALTNAIGKKQMEREREKAINELKRSRENLRALSAHLQSVREEERTRIAREIHDELGQALTALKMDLLWLHGRIAAVPAKDPVSFDETLKSMAVLIDSTINTVRRIATELRPGVLDDLGLVPAIEWQAQEFQKRTGITTRFTTTLRDAAVDRERSTAIFRILQESLTNVARHANATNVHIRFEMTGRYLMLTVADNGRGISTDEINSAASLGLLGMKERGTLLGGEIDIFGTPGIGTTVSVTMPRSAAEERK